MSKIVKGKNHGHNSNDDDHDFTRKCTFPNYESIVIDDNGE